MRLFIGIPLGDTVGHELVAEVKRLRSSHRNPAISDNVRWSAQESWHITLQFLGKADGEQYKCIEARLHDVRHSPVAIELGKIGTFPRAGVLFVDVRVTPELTALQQAITIATHPCGFTPEDRPYHPHITLARRKGKSEDGNFRNLKLQTTPLPHFSGFNADSFVLYESAPTPEGSRYEIREQFALHT